MQAKNQRKLTETEKKEFLTRLSELVLEFGVSIEAVMENEGYSSRSKLEICDYFGHDVFTDYTGFDETDAQEFVR